ncbi:MAG: hypothetical protein LBG17_04450 [Bacteroidales bacterium]|nr:hypothetical protein [Bacteroidales bacterium]
MSSAELSAISFQRAIRLCASLPVMSSAELSAISFQRAIRLCASLPVIFEKQ